MSLLVISNNLIVEIWLPIYWKGSWKVEDHGILPRDKQLQAIPPKLFMLTEASGKKVLPKTSRPQPSHAAASKTCGKSGASSNKALASCSPRTWLLCCSQSPVLLSKATGQKAGLPHCPRDHSFLRWFHREKGYASPLPACVLSYADPN